MTKKNDVKNVPLYVHVPPDLKEKFAALAAKRGTTNSALARQMIEEYMTYKGPRRA